MNIKKLQELKNLTKKIGIYTSKDLQSFQRLQNCNGKNILQALKTYSEELGDDFTIKQ